ncbi:MAG: hypothetical protein JWR03_1420 [Cohnella sp.]|nr:hypothetical protein [Cohnella sp.]
MPIKKRIKPKSVRNGMAGTKFPTKESTEPIRIAQPVCRNVILERQMAMPFSMPPTRMNRFVNIIKINSPGGRSPCASSGALAFRKGKTKATTGSKPISVRRNKKMKMNPTKPNFPTRFAISRYTPGKPNDAAIAPMIRMTEAAEPPMQDPPALELGTHSFQQ